MLKLILPEIRQLTGLDFFFGQIHSVYNLFKQNIFLTCFCQWLSFQSTIVNDIIPIGNNNIVLTKLFAETVAGLTYEEAQKQTVGPLTNPHSSHIHVGIRNTQN